MSDEAGKLDASIKMLSNTLNEMLTWIRITSYPVVRDILVKEFDSPGDSIDTRKLKRKVYSLTDGKKSTREIEKLTGGKITYATIAAYQRWWRKQGLATSVDPTNPQSKTKKVFDLEDFDLG
jgi:hypothetical protein